MDSNQNLDTTVEQVNQLKNLLNSGVIAGQVIQQEVPSAPVINSESELQDYANAYDEEQTEKYGVPVYTVTKNNFPSKLTSITFKEALFEDRREATRLYPSARVGYSLEELLLANQIIAMDFNNIENEIDFRRQPINKLAVLTSSDNAYLLSVFLSTATLSSEMSADIKNKTEKVLQDPYFNGTYTVTAEDMPTQSFSVTFKEPVGQDRFDVEKLYPGASDKQCGYSSEEMLFAHQIIAINGQPVNRQGKELISILNKWSHIDVQYAVAVFTSIFSLTEEKSDESRVLGKSFLQKRKSRSVKGR
jgi:hypothetical protein